MIGKLLHNVARLLTRRGSYRFLAASEADLAAASPKLQHAWVGVIVLSLAWGLAAVGVWAAAWTLFGEPTGRLMPAVAVTAALLLGPPRRAVVATMELLAGRDPTVRALAASVLAVGLVAAMASLQPDYYRTDAPLHWAVEWIRPWVKLYRVLILMPLWGGWAMLITPQFVRPREGGDAAATAFARGCGPISAAAVMGLLLALTITYFNFLPWEQVGISVAIIVSAIAAGLLCCRLDGGLTRRALLAANVLTQIATLLACLAGRNLLYW